MKYSYYATLLDTDEAVEVSFHDFPTINTFGDDEEQAVKMAEETLKGFLLDSEADGIEIPTMTSMSEITLSGNERLAKITIDTSI